MAYLGPGSHRKNASRCVRSIGGNTGITTGTGMHGLRLSFALWFLLFLAGSGCLRVTGPTSHEDRNDSAISKELEAKFAGHQLGGLSDIVVTSEAGVVTLAGKVEKAEQKARAADLARQVKGVKRVRNDLDIRPTRPE